MPAWRVRAYVGEEMWRDYFKFAFDAQSLGPADLVVYLQDEAQTQTAKSRPLHGAQETRLCHELRIYTIEDEVTVDYRGQVRDARCGPPHGARARRRQASVEIPCSNVTRGRKRDVAYQNDFTPSAAIWWREWYAPEIALFGYEFSRRWWARALRQNLTNNSLARGAGVTAPLKREGYFQRLPY